MNLTADLRAIQEEVEGYAREFGLDFFETIFELVDCDELNGIAAYGGFPTRYPHWRFGMEFDSLQKSYAYGLSKIYELVINNDPCYAYLMKSNATMDQKMVMAHVYGHCDFFKNNMCFSKTNRKMMDQMANHGSRIRRYMEQHGVENVERFVDVCLSIDNLIDQHGEFIARSNQSYQPKSDSPSEGVRRLRSKDYMESFINPPEFIEAEKARLTAVAQEERHFPREPYRDVLLFLIEHAPLARWQRDILSMLREEAYYFAPQGQTKIMNEGWASYWHSTIMTKRALRDSEVVDYADHHSGTVHARPGQINPYKVGIELFRDIEDRWNKGKFGREFEDCDDLETKRNWNRDLGLGREKIFEVRRIYNDITFIDEFLTEEFAEQQQLFVFQFNPRTGRHEIADRDWQRVKRELLFGLTNFGQPIISVVDANHANRGELYLRHQWEGIDIQFDWAVETLRNLHQVWTRPVHIETKEEGKGRLLSFDGEKGSIQEITPAD